MDRPLRTTVIGCYPFPGWLEFAAAHLDEFGPADVAEAQDDAVVAALHDQVAAGLDVVTDGEQTRLDFNLSFYGHLEGLDLEAQPPRRFGPPAHDQRGKHEVDRRAGARRDGLGALEEWERLRRLAPPGPDLKMSVPGPVHAERPPAAQRRLPGPLGADRGAAADRRARAGGARRGRLPRDHRRRAVDELLRPPRGPGALRGHLQPHRRRRWRAAAGSRRTSASATTRATRSGLRRYAPLFPAFHELARRRAPRRDGQPRVRRGRGDRRDRRARGRRGRHRRRQELLRRDAGGHRAARAAAASSTRRPSSSRWRPTAGSARPRAGRRGEAGATCARGCARVRETL